MQSLTEVRTTWEKGLAKVTSFGKNSVYVVLKDKDNKYHCHRYFMVGQSWECSVDYRAISDPDAVMRWMGLESRVD